MTIQQKADRLELIFRQARSKHKTSRHIWPLLRKLRGRATELDNQAARRSMSVET